MNDGSAFQKRRQVLELLNDGLVMLHLDPRAQGVIVPDRFKSDAVLRLNIAYQFRLPALEIGAEGIYAVLSFDRQNFPCTLPWSSIFAATLPNTGHKGVVWPGSVPPELAHAFAQAGIRAPTRLEPDPPADATPALEPADGQRPTAQEDAPPAPVAAEGKRRGHLKLVKG